MPEYLVWSCSPVNNACRLASVEGFDRPWDLAAGVSLSKKFPRDARARMSSAFKKATGLTDDLSNTDKVKICSKRLVEFLKEEGVKKLEFLPFTILDHKGKVASADYFVVNPVGLVDALNVKASGPDYSAVDEDKIDRVKRIVLDPKRLDPDRRVFRLASFFYPVLIEKGLAEAMKAKGLVGPYFKSLDVPAS